MFSALSNAPVFYIVQKLQIFYCQCFCDRQGHNDYETVL